MSLLLLASVLALGACASSGSGSGSGQDPNVIGTWELNQHQDYNALEAVRRLRPQWLRRRGQPSALAEAGTGSRYPRVHLDGVPLSDIDELESIRASDVREMRFLSGTEASTRFGTGYSNGVILVVTSH